jgi:hypothetical protein
VDVPAGEDIVNATDAPGAARAPCNTIALIVAVEFFVNVVVGTESVTDIGCDAGFTVRFAMLSIDPVPPATTASTEYVAADVPDGTAFVMDVETLEPGDIVRTLCPNVVGHVPGKSDDMLND